jgi:hypothetical protein
VKEETRQKISISSTAGEDCRLIKHGRIISAVIHWVSTDIYLLSKARAGKIHPRAEDHCHKKDHPVLLAWWPVRVSGCFNASATYSQLNLGATESSPFVVTTLQDVRDCGISRPSLLLSPLTMASPTKNDQETVRAYLTLYAESEEIWSCMWLWLPFDKKALVDPDS